jgi:hypothetical protein
LLSTSTSIAAVLAVPGSTGAAVLPDDEEEDDEDEGCATGPGSG